jgi:hypothetical protein
MNIFSNPGLGAFKTTIEAETNITGMLHGADATLLTTSIALL